MNPVIEYTNAEILLIANQQRRVLRLFLVALIIVYPLELIARLGTTPDFPGLTLPAAARVLSLVVQVVWTILVIVFAFRLAKALKSRVAWWYVILMLVPCVSLLALLVLNHQATSVLRAGGIRVGLLGARREATAKIDKHGAEQAEKCR